MKKDLSWGVDLGSSKVSISGVHSSSGNLVYSECYNKTFIEDGVIKDFYGLVEFLRKVFDDIKYSRNLSSINVACSVKTRHITTHKNSFAFALTPERERVITPKDVDYLVQQAILLEQEWDMKIIFKEAVCFVVDNSQKVKDPVGLWGRKLNGEVLSLSAPYSFYENLNKLFQYLGIRLVGITSSGFGSFMASNTENKDFLFIDIGYSLAEVLVCKEGILSDRWIMDFGCSLLDKAISERFQIPANLSQKIREDFIDLSREDNEEILIRIEQSYLNLESSEVGQTIQEVCSGFLKSVKEECAKRGYSDIFKKNIYLTGGFSLIKGIEEFLMGISGSQVSRAEPSCPVDSESDFLRNSSSLGAALYCQTICREKEHKGVKKFLHFLKDLYVDYF